VSRLYGECWRLSVERAGYLPAATNPAFLSAASSCIAGMACE